MFKRFKKKKLCCPRCKNPFSDWFTWDGLRYCYPCYGFGKPYHRLRGIYVVEAKIFTENEGVLL